MDIANTPDELPMVLSIEDICKILCIGKNSAYTLIRAGHIKHFRVGRQIRITKSALLEYINHSHI